MKRRALPSVAHLLLLRLLLKKEADDSNVAGSRRVMQKTLEARITSPQGKPRSQ
jgi:hypothetical protein